MNEDGVHRIGPLPPPAVLHQQNEIMTHLVRVAYLTASADNPVNLSPGSHAKEVQKQVEVPVATTTIKVVGESDWVDALDNQSLRDPLISKPGDDVCSRSGVEGRKPPNVSTAQHTSATHRLFKF